jgi:excisionase family DNA binding protein
MDKLLSSDPRAQPLPPLAVRIADATRLTGIGKTKLFELIAKGTLETTSIGRRRLILYRSLQRLIEGQNER